jgi:hypothetical protein
MQMQDARIISLERELIMKTPNCIETSLMAAFRAQGPNGAWTPSAKSRQTSKSRRQFD